jgi:hypothetical protein
LYEGYGIFLAMSISYLCIWVSTRNGIGTFDFDSSLSADDGFGSFGSNLRVGSCERPRSFAWILPERLSSRGFILKSTMCVMNTFILKFLSNWLHFTSLFALSIISLFKNKVPLLSTNQVLNQKWNDFSPLL